MEIKLGKMILKGLLGLVFTAAVVFLLAGRIDYWQGWIFVGITLLRFVVGVLLFRDNPELIQERFKPGPGTKSWDKVFYAFYAPLFLAILIIGCLDSGRYFWSGAIGFVFVGVGIIFQFIAHSLVLWAMKVNAFFSSTVRIQEERGQKVVTEGPYSKVRHPGYVGAIFLAIGTAFTLESVYALIPAIGVVVTLFVRTGLEDATLQKELTGYTEYANRTKFKLIPGLW
jgi:protein-S-isoprenylcysteine O-methyltransferase Ste14